MTLKRRDGKWYGESASDIRELLSRHKESTGDNVDVVQEVVCDCGSRVFSILLDDEYQEAVWICQRCDAQYLFHTKRVSGYYEGNSDGDIECCNCPCSIRGGSYFELAVGVTLHEGSQDVDWAFIACRCVVCGLTGYLAEWHRIGYPYQELFDHMNNKQET
jgi:hypothetical protein